MLANTRKSWLYIFEEKKILNAIFCVIYYSLNKIGLALEYQRTHTKYTRQLISHLHYYFSFSSKHMEQRTKCFLKIKYTNSSKLRPPLTSNEFSYLMTIGHAGLFTKTKRMNTTTSNNFIYAIHTTINDNLALKSLIHFTINAF